MSLRLRISLYFAFLFTFIVGIIFFVFREEEIQYLKKSLEKDAVNSSLSLAVASKDFLLAERLPDLIKLCYEIKKRGDEEGDVVYAFVVDNNGIIKGAWSEEFVGKKVEELNIPLSNVEFVYQDKNIVYNRVSSIFYKDVRIGSAIVGVSSKKLNLLLKKAHVRMFVFFLIFLFVGVTGIFLIGTYIVKPVKRIIESIEDIGRGNFDVSTGIKGKDEIGKIAKEIENMAKKLKIAQKEIQEKERMKKDMEISMEIQKALIPSKVPDIPGYEITIFYKPAFFVSGDYIDIINLPLNRTLIILGDVSGKGAGSSLLMGMLKMNVISLARSITSPKNLLVSLYKSLKDLIPQDMFVTVVAGLIEENGKIIFSSAGHFPPLIFRKDEGRFERVEIKSLPIGFPFLPFDEFLVSLGEREIFLNKGDLMIFYTDGLIEIQDERGDFFGEERLKSVIYKFSDGVEELKNRIIKDLTTFSGLREQNDDISFVVIKKK